MTPPEPVVACREIQGDVLGGFRKDNEALLFISVADPALAPFKRWIGTLADRLSYSDSVLAFNAAFRAMRRRLQADPPMQATWVNFAITGAGAKRLLAAAAATLLDATFLNGPLADADFVGEPAPAAPDGPNAWIVGAPGAEPDALLVIAADDPRDLEAMIASLRGELTALGPAPNAIAVHREDGRTRTSQPGHEHFGFKDGISQPGVRGLVDTNAGPFITRRVLDPADPLAPLFSAPGQPLCWPGEFVLGYPKKKPGSNDPFDIVTDPVDDLLMNGSYLVYRRLVQDVPRFADFVGSTAAALAKTPAFAGMTPEHLGALMVGRWASGVPVMRAPAADDANIAKDMVASNSFFYAKNTAVPRYAAGVDDIPPDTYRLATADPRGIVCPFPAHVRKVNTRDQTTDQGNGVRMLEHRILRRGIPFGPEYDPTDPASAGAARGLQFLCYQASIPDGFQFLMNQWANSEDNPLSDHRGFDPIIGQNGTAARSFTLIANGARETIAMPDRFVKTTGAAYLFSPSRTALKKFFAV